MNLLKLYLRGKSLPRRGDRVKHPMMSRPQVVRPVSEPLEGAPEKLHSVRRKKRGKETGECSINRDCIYLARRGGGGKPKTASKHSKRRKGLPIGVILKSRNLKGGNRLGLSLKKSV